MATILTDEEIIDYLLGIMYNNNDYQDLDQYKAVVLLEEMGVGHVDAVRIWDYMANRLFITPKHEGRGVYILASGAMFFMRKHGSYLKYIKSQEEPELRKEKREQTDSMIKNIGIIAALVVSLSTLFVTQYNRWQDKRQLRKEGISPAMEAKIDSLLKVLSPSKTDTPKQSKADTATNK